MKKIPTTYKTEDGREFTDRDEAERHERFIKALKAFESSRDELGRALAQTLRTADGQLLDFSSWRDYFYITDGWSGMPELKEVSFYVWNIGIDSYREHMDVKDLAIWQDDSTRRDRKYYKVRELYADKKTAQRALLAAQEEWLAQQVAWIEEARKKLK